MENWSENGEYCFCVVCHRLLPDSECQFCVCAGASAVAMAGIKEKLTAEFLRILMKQIYISIYVCASGEKLAFSH